jgi:hypothetical protein
MLAGLYLKARSGLFEAENTLGLFQDGLFQDG